MACYLCAYQSQKNPHTSKPLPGDSQVAGNEPLGTCWRCRVWACAEHGTRYAAFECAICQPARAVEGALGLRAPRDGAPRTIRRVG